MDEILETLFFLQDDLGESSGFDIVRGYIQKGKSNCKEMADFFKERLVY